MTKPAAVPPPAETSQRLDKWLWYARVAKSRSLAAAAIAEGMIRINRAKVAKPSQTVKIGDVVTSRMQKTVRIYRVASLGTRRGPAPEAKLLYDDLTPPPEPKEAVKAAEPWGARSAGAGRPTKRDRRRIDSLKSHQ